MLRQFLFFFMKTTESVFSVWAKRLKWRFCLRCSALCLVSLIWIGCGSGSVSQSESSVSSKSSEQSSDVKVDSNSDSDSKPERETIGKGTAAVKEVAKTGARAVSGELEQQSQIATGSVVEETDESASHNQETRQVQSQTQSQSQGMGLFVKQPMPNEVLKELLQNVKTLVAQGDFNAAFFTARSAANWKLNAKQMEILKEISSPITKGQEKLKNWQAKSEKPSEAELNKYSLQVGSEALAALEKVEI